MSEHTKEPAALRAAAERLITQAYDLHGGEFLQTASGERFSRTLDAHLVARAFLAYSNALAGIPTDKLAEHVAAVARLREAAKASNETVYLIAAYLHEQGKKFYAEKLRETADDLAAALAAMEGSK